MVRRGQVERGTSTGERWRILLRRPVWFEADARRILDALAASGLSIAEFARQHEVTPQRLTWWRWRLRHGGRPGRGLDGGRVSFVRVHVRPGSARNGDSVERSPAAAMEVVVEGGRVVRVPPGFDASDLVRVVRALEEAC